MASEKARFAIRATCYDPRMSDRLQDLLDGTTGHFWTKIEDVRNMERAANGYVELKSDDLVHIETLTTLELIRSRYASATATREMPRAIYAAVKPAGAVFFDFAGYTGNNILGAVRASSDAYRVHSVLCGVDLRNVASDKFMRMLVTFPKTTFWTGFDGVPIKGTKDPQGRSTAVETSMSAATTTAGPIHRGIKLSLSSHWSVTGPDDVRVFSNPLSVITESTQPKDWWEHLEPILAVQDLISMAYQGFVVAGVGTASLEMTEINPRTTSAELWMGRMMTVPPGSKAPKSMNEFPVFNLQDIGGVRGVDAWAELTRKYGRATGPISKVHRYGSGLAVETRCMEIAAAIDYWSEIHRRAGAVWAARTNGTLTQVLAKFVGPAFEEFVGDIQVWSKIFRDTYNRIKHEPVFSYDPEDVHTVTRSAEILLQSALLNRISRNKRMTKTVCDSHRNYDIGMAVREIVERGQL